MSGRLTVVGAALLGVVTMMAAGCNQELMEARAAASRANEALEKANGALRQLRGEYQKLQQEMVTKDTLLADKDAKLSALQKGYDDVSAAYRKLLGEYESLAGKPPMVLGGSVLGERLDALLKRLADESGGLLKYYPEYGMVKMEADLTFDKGSTNIRQQALAALQKLADIVNSPDAGKFNVYVAGHTDDIPVTQNDTLRAHGSNWGLSAHRALAVVEALFKDGVAQPRMAGVAFSKYHPVAANAPNTGGSPANRRVEIWIVPPDRFLTTKGVAAPAERPSPKGVVPKAAPVAPAAATPAEEGDEAK